ncbi:MAG: hypothetical protein KF884_06480 [Fimbriimonadaceae bacterium]|nr:hypothetical protein [Fimbriimonadaceae bacterium]QYK57196.1 MAG: hypothetical protein KF884_06480 [Fimbriimonadaceae bacterium]
MPLYLGLDGGGSGLRARLIDETGATVSEGRAGPANAARSSGEELEAVFMAATQGFETPSAVAACLAGVVSPSIERKVLGALAKVFPGSARTAWPDLAALPWAAGSGAAGVVLSGTGSAVVSWQGGLVWSGGGGPLIGDLGSAFDMGRRWVRLTLAAGAPDEAVKALCQALGVARTREAALLAQEPNGIEQIAALAVPLADYAEEGAEWAFGEIVAALHDLATLTARHIAEHSPEGDRLELAGGVWTAHPNYQKAFQKCLDGINMWSNSRQYSLAPLADLPDLGAARLARHTSNGH